MLYCFSTSAVQERNGAPHLRHSFQVPKSEAVAETSLQFYKHLPHRHPRLRRTKRYESFVPTERIRLRVSSAIEVVRYPSSAARILTLSSNRPERTCPIASQPPTVRTISGRPTRAKARPPLPRDVAIRTLVWNESVFRGWFANFGRSVPEHQLMHTQEAQKRIVRRWSTSKLLC